MKTTNPFYTLVLLIISVALTSAFAQQTPRTLSFVDGELYTIFSDDTSPYAERIQLIHALPSNLTPEQLERCRAFLESPLARQSLADLEFNGLKNELVFAMLRQRNGLTELAEILVRMSYAPETDNTWRDYCVQFLGKCYPRINDPASHEMMANALWNALKTQRKGRAAGSAARQLMMLSRAFPEFSPENVASASLEALLDPTCSDESKVALLQVCGILGERGAIAVARAIAGRGAVPVLRASAIATVGMLGDSSDLTLLRTLAASGDVRVSKPAATAIDKILKKNKPSF